MSHYAAVHGFAGISALRSSLQALAEIPEDMVHSEWLHAIVAEARANKAVLEDHFARTAAWRMRTHSEKVRVPDLRVGELVLVHRSFYERGSGAILPQCNGLYLIARLSSAPTCVLEDALSGEPYMSGELVSVNRLVRFAFPADWALVSSQTTSVLETMESLVVGDIVLVEPRSSQMAMSTLGRLLQLIPCTTKWR